MSPDSESGPVSRCPSCGLSASDLDDIADENLCRNDWHYAPSQPVPSGLDEFRWVTRKQLETEIVRLRATITAPAACPHHPVGCSLIEDGEPSV